MFIYDKKHDAHYLTFTVRHGQSFAVANSTDNVKIYYVESDAGFATYMAESNESFAIEVAGCTLETKVYNSKLYLEEKTCGNCMQHIGEECGITGKEIDSNTSACDSHEES